MTLTSRHQIITTIITITCWLLTDDAEGDKENGVGSVEGVGRDHHCDGTEEMLKWQLHHSDSNKHVAHLSCHVTDCVPSGLLAVVSSTSREVRELGMSLKCNLHSSFFFGSWRETEREWPTDEERKDRTYTHSVFSIEVYKYTGIYTVYIYLSIWEAWLFNNGCTLHLLKVMADRCMRRHEQTTCVRGRSSLLTLICVFFFFTFYFLFRNLRKTQHIDEWTAVLDGLLVIWRYLRFSYFWNWTWKFQSHFIISRLAASFF